MANPRYSRDPARREPSRREQRLDEYSQFQEGAQRQQVLDSNSQAQMMRQLQEMYGLQQQAQMSPLQMEALRASTEAQGLANEQQRFQNAWAQPNAEAAYNLTQAQAQGLTDRASGKITPRDELEFLQATGQEYVSPEKKAAAAQAQTQNNWREIEGNARRFGVNPDDTEMITNQFGPENLAYLQTLMPPPPPPSIVPLSERAGGLAQGFASPEKLELIAAQRAQERAAATERGERLKQTLGAFFLGNPIKR